MVKVRDYIIRATELTAINVWKLIVEKRFASTDLLTEEESKSREKLIDQTGADTMRAALTDIPFTLKVVGSEGRKHVHQYGEALPTLEGVFGSGSRKMDMVNDVVEGSKAAKLNSPGAVSIIAVSSDKGLMATPKDIDYMDKLFGPPQLRGKISFQKSIEENLMQVVITFGVKPSKINVVVMDRDRNAHLINACQRFGVKLILIKAGDLMPAVLACTDPIKHKKGIFLVMGIGGFEEGILSAVAAKALGAVGEGRGWSADLETNKKYSSFWSLDELISGKREECLVSISAITEDTWFNLPKVRLTPEGYEVTTLTVSDMGVKIEKRVHH
ncbi:MAG: fructose 1,6-bisphosphatase II [uncultured bacterium]|uniref:fructose-bisphosphatase n=1 Tax=Candidatus Daviesbacteria bacterium GW2011_GWC2_40_12 TaxID=1618431 RepID=A0A0G0QPA8_9BACT|nr:MAG: fructose 1,6-bisphosphatase II [uncultured bacterium]KKQ82173.1 MAG: Fructose-1,6-bisphosphatase [Candidatus Daviesbacteria bacterium GW2011_GWF2_38_7]KKR16378.1 MAG: Fructose-1,6-bisphosphatase [Candidatus Daviesbacteria bacterium GW2011_GWA2_39_33]KKR23360.1 MAG: Fructose-1,6-bisphosphatase [Candidatus Daviesbacteria bacterium GW2011_GWB1_39_5]KKR42249.1 MAG: Fructose-1,6-bisphosphatase [Candidatus Daviesbacteria bacterium GW2011_GWC2_40_12]OGE21993.1 MAG: hypothetical protein A2778_